MDDNETRDQETATEASPGYMIVLGQRELTLRFAQFDYAPDIFVRARPTLLEEDDVAQAALSLHWEQKAQQGGGSRAQRRARGQRGKKQAAPDETIRMEAAISPGNAFVAKCVAQVVDFRLPILERGSSKPSFRTYDERHRGDNESNREIYENLLQAGAEAFRELTEQFLDYAAGRGTDAQADFEAFLAEHPLALGGS